MNDQLIFRPAVASDAPRIMQIIRQAQAQMAALGSQQWQDGYPAPANIDRDIDLGYGWVLARPGSTTSGNAAPDGIAPGEVIAYGAVVFDGEPAYNQIDGAWLTAHHYVALHRLAVADGEKQRGVAAEYMLRVEQLARAKKVKSFRVDTNFDNGYMLRLLERIGFLYCGKVYYQSGERLAFEKPL